MNHEIISSTFLQIVIILLLTLIIVIAFYYITRNYNSQTTETTAIEKYLSTLSEEDMPEAMLADTQKTNNDIINGEAGFQNFCFNHTKINGKLLNVTDTKRTILHHYKNKVDELEQEHFSYLKNLELIEPTRQDFANFRYRTVTAIFLEKMFGQKRNFLNKILQHSPNPIIPQKSIIHELITHTHQKGYFSFINNTTSKIFDSEENVQNHITKTDTSCMSIEVINSHTIKCKAKIEMLYTDKKANDSKKNIHKVKSSLTFTMSASPENIYYISYSNIKFKLDIPKTMEQFTNNKKQVNRATKFKLDLSKITQQLTKNIDRVKRTQETSNHAVLINKSKNRLVYQLPDFASPGLLYARQNQETKHAAQYQR
ncbi:hypothetical protein K6025_01970 [Ehrlichia sp. JZT12]